MHLTNRIFLFLIVIPACLSGFPDKYQLTGEGRLRFRYVDADQDAITGSYGETLKQGLSLRQRFDVSLDYFLTDYLTIGGTIRISNEEYDSMLPPPDLISTRVAAGWWYAKLYHSPFDISLGAYEASFTPLSLMRWEQNDNPLSASGCGCQVAVGGISGESMEELKADYLLEGGQAKIKKEFYDVTLLYARPEVDVETQSYARHLTGGRARIIIPYTRNFSTLTIGITGLRVLDDQRSIEQAPYTPLQSDVFGLDINLPLFWKISCIAEYARSIRDDNLLSDIDVVHKENGLYGGASIKSGDVIDANALFMRLEPYFSPLYRALSYAKNRQGFRGSLTVRKIPFLAQDLTISLYTKLLREIKPTWNEAITGWHSALADYGVGNIGFNYTVLEQWHLEGSYEYRKTRRDDDIFTLNYEAIDLSTHVVSCALTYEFTFQSKIILQYQYIKNIDDIGPDDYKAHMPSLQFSFKF